MPSEVLRFVAMTDDRTPPTSSEVAELWDTAARGWIRNADLIDRMSSSIRTWIRDHIDAQPGETVLELAAGAGDTGFEVARSLAPDGRLITSDISQQMLDAARERGQRLGLSNVEYRQIDAQRIDLDDGLVDAVIHRFGPMLLPDPDASFAEVRRVLTPAGRYASVVWAGPESNPWIPMTGMSLMQAGVQPPGDPFGPGGMFSLSDPDVLRERIVGSGFSDVQVELVANAFEFANFDELWKIPSEIAGPIAVIITKLESDQVTQVKDAFRGMTEQFRDGDAYHLPAQSLCALAR